MSEKVKLRREVIIAIGHYSEPSLEYTKYGVLTCILSKTDEVAIVARKSLIDQYGEGQCWDVLMEALVSGYEIEEAPEDKIRKAYNHLYETRSNFNGLEVQEFICRVLNLLNIKIEGVNAE